MKQFYNLILFLFFILSTNIVVAQLSNFSLSVAVTNETCPSNGALNFVTSGTNTNATIAFSVYKLPNISTPVATTPSTTLSGLDSGNYKVVATQTLGTASNSQEQTVSILDLVTPLSFNLSITQAICGNDGALTVNIISGNAVNYEIFSGPVLAPLQPINTFQNLIPGSYLVRVFDNCGQGVTQAFTVIAPEIFDNVITITDQLSVSSTPIVNCNLIRLGHRIDVVENSFIAFPLTFAITTFPPDGSTPIVTTYTFQGNSNYLSGLYPAIGPVFEEPFIFHIPYFPNTYTYDITVTDACGNSYAKNNNVIDDKFEVSAVGAFAFCGTKRLAIGALNQTLPITVEFLDAPPEFVPTAYNSSHPNFISLPIYGTEQNPVPYGNYTVRVTDACGFVDTKSVLIENGFEPQITAIPETCGVKVYVTLPGTPIVSGTIISGPPNPGFVYPQDVSNYILTTPPMNLQIPGFITPGNYIINFTDICGNSYSELVIIPPINKELIVNVLPGCGENFGSVAFSNQLIILEEVIFTSGPSTYTAGFPSNVSEHIHSGGFKMNSIPTGVYQAKTTDSCGIVRNLTLFISGYFHSAEVTINKFCSSFELLLEHTHNSPPPFAKVYKLQKFNDVTQEWVHPITGLTTGADYSLTNNSWNLNIGASGHFRIIFEYQIYNYPNNIFCSVLVKEFDVETGIQVNNILNFACSSTISDVYVDISGSGPFIFKIIEKDGQPFEVNNNNEPLFTNLETGVYTFLIEDSCGNISVIPHDVFVSYTFAISSSLCQGQNSSLSVPNFEYLTYQWFKEGAPNQILSTTSILNLANLDFETDSGNYFVIISYPQNPDSCLNQMLSFNVNQGIIPNAGENNFTTLCDPPNTLDLNTFLQGNFDENGTWEQINSGGLLTANVWDLQSIENGIYEFKYIVNGLCNENAEALITLQILDEMPVPEINSLASICSGNDINLTIINGNPTFSYSWIGPNNYTSNQQNPVIQNASSAMNGIYIVTVTAGNCQVSSSIEILINSLPDFTFTNETIVICQDQNATIEVIPTSLTSIAYEFVWYLNNEEIIGENTSSIEINEPGIYSVIISSGDCSITKTIEVTENTALFEVGITANCQNNSFIITAFSVNNSFDESTATYSWTGPNGFSATTATVDISNLPAGIYTVIVTDIGGCSVESSSNVTGTRCVIPKGLSPNGDGQNDTWDLSAFDILKVKIFNRYGLEVYDENRYKNQWHGQSFNGKMLPSATYYYYIRFTSGEEATGWVYLNREVK